MLKDVKLINFFIKGVIGTYTDDSPYKSLNNQLKFYYLIFTTNSLWVLNTSN
jgi:hypothetical protein